MTTAKQRPGRDGLGPDHPDRRQPRHLHEDRLQAEAGRRVPQHLVDLPRLQHLHAGQGPARRALHHQPDLRHLRRQPRHLLGVRAEHGLRGRARRTSASGSSTSARPPSTCSTTTSSRRTWSGSTTARRWSPRPTPACWSWPTRTEAPHAGDHGYRTIGDIMRSLNPLEGEFYREALQVSRYTREMFCLMEGRHVHPSTLYPGGVGTVATRPAVHRLPDPADALRRVHEAGRADARRPVRLLLRGAARLRGGRPAPGPARLLGRAQRPASTATSATRR